MAEKNDAAKAAAAFRAMDHNLGAQRYAEPGNWIPTVQQAQEAASDLAGAPVAQAEGVAPANPQPNESSQGSNGQ